MKRESIKKYSNLFTPIKLFGTFLVFSVLFIFIHELSNGHLPHYWELFVFIFLFAVLLFGIDYLFLKRIKRFEKVVIIELLLVISILCLWVFITK